MVHDDDDVLEWDEDIAAAYNPKPRKANKKKREYGQAGLITPCRDGTLRINVIIKSEPSRFLTEPGAGRTSPAGLGNARQGLHIKSWKAVNVNCSPNVWVWTANAGEVLFEGAFGGFVALEAGRIGCTSPTMARIYGRLYFDAQNASLPYYPGMSEDSVCSELI
ncbi:hypothetical protein BCR34DRAFT_597435 [Clohesyomyces aquaticus]|uniref:Uncharacterized protein n=1 Tax=Clohesyomyces aquaticus TaxID=1231657 RepID=A0A1Y2A2N1_9PLEO|nr:hypothetical protein BCR34DRAFT_597435 [Clohesyomyces aquaticus]